MAGFTAPLETAFELQRTLLQQSQETVDTSRDFQTSVNRTLIDSFEEQEDIQRRMLALQHVVIHKLCDRLDEQVPGAHLATDEFRDVVDVQFDRLYQNHEDFFASLIAELENSVDAYDDVSIEYLDAVDDQLDLLVTAYEDLEAQSVEAAEQFDDRIDSLQAEVVDLREQVDPVAL